MQVYDVAVLGEGHNEIRDRRADVADHDARDNEQGHLAHALREDEHEAHRQHRAEESGENHAGRADNAAAREQTDHREGNGQLCAGRDAEHERTGDGVREKGLEQKAGDRKRPAEQQGGDKPRQADLPHDGGVFARAREQNIRDLSRGEVQTAGIQVPEDERGEQRGKQSKAERIACTVVRLQDFPLRFRSADADSAGCRYFRPKKSRESPESCRQGPWRTEKGSVRCTRHFRFSRP